MSMFSKDVPNLPDTQSFRIVRIQAGPPQQFCFFDGFGIVGTVHWNGERSVLCTRDDKCEACALHGPPRIESWHYVYDHNRQTVILALPGKPTNEIKRLDNARGSLRGAVISFDRAGNKRSLINCRFIRECSRLPDQDQVPQWDLTTVLMVLFGSAKLDIE